MKYTLKILLLLVLFQSSAQNLVPNPSFEDTTICPWSYDGINLGFAEYWFAPGDATSDLIHECSAQYGEIFLTALGYQVPNTGESFAGLLTFYETYADQREYISVKLLTTLQMGQLYHFRMFVSRADSMNYSSLLGVYFCPDSLHSDYIPSLNFTPQVEASFSITNKLDWTCVSGSFTATGNENYLIIGNLRDDANSDIIFTGDGGTTDPAIYNAAYYFIDDIYLSVTPLEDCNEITNTIEIESTTPKVLIKIVDIIGRESEDKPNTLLIYVYSDGTTEKIFRTND